MVSLTRRSLLTGTAMLAFVPARSTNANETQAGHGERRLSIGREARQLRQPPSATTPMIALNGSDPGIVRLNAGEDHRLIIANELDENVSLGWHGLRGLHPNLLPPIAAGSTRDAAMRVADPGISILRGAPIGRAAEWSERGLSGLMIIETPNPPEVDADLACAIDDIRLGDDGDIAPFGVLSDIAGPGRLGNVLLVNGLPAPLVRPVPPGARVRLRLANLCGARIMRVRFDRLRAWVIAVDGQPTDTFQPLRAELPFAPGSRYEIMVEAPVQGEGRVVAALGGGLPLVILAADEAAGAAREGLRAAEGLPANPALPLDIPLQRAIRTDVAIEGGAMIGADGKVAYSGDPAAIWRMNGRRGEETGKPLLRAGKGAPVVMAVANRTAWPQPMHLQGHVFRLLHPLDDGWEPYWLDTVTVAPGQTARIAFVAEAPGRWLFASTVLDRMDHGLFGVVEIG